MRKGYDVLDEFVFVERTAVSAQDENRPEFARMFSLALHDPCPFSVIVVLNRTRFMRNYEKSVVHQGMLKRRNIRLESVEEPVDDTATGDLVTRILDAVSEYQLDYLRPATKRGMDETARQGYLRIPTEAGH